VLKSSGEEPARGRPIPFLGYQDIDDPATGCWSGGSARVWRAICSRGCGARRCGCHRRLCGGRSGPGHQLISSMRRRPTSGNHPGAGGKSVGCTPSEFARDHQHHRDDLCGGQRPGEETPGPAPPNPGRRGLPYPKWLVVDQPIATSRAVKAPAIRGGPKGIRVWRVAHRRTIMVTAVRLP
jgi:hypothetical protein